MIEHLGTWAVGLAGIAGLIAISLRGGRKRRTKTADLVARRHRRYQAKGERVRGVLGHMQPLQNPAKCFAYLGSPQGLCAKRRSKVRTMNMAYAAR